MKPLTNNVTIAGVSSGYTTTLNGAILAGATAITLTNTTTWAHHGQPQMVTQSS